MDYCKGHSHKHTHSQQQQWNTHLCCVFAPTTFFFFCDINLNCCWRLNVDLNVSTGTSSSLKYRSSSCVGVCWRYCTCTCSWSDKGRVGEGRTKGWLCWWETQQEWQSMCLGGGLKMCANVCVCSCQLTFRGLPISAFLHQSAICTSKSVQILRMGSFIEILLHCWRKKKHRSRWGRPKNKSKASANCRSKLLQARFSQNAGKHPDGSAGLFDGEVHLEKSATAMI